MPLQSFVDQQLPTIKAAWLNMVDVLAFSVFNSAATAQQARTAILPSQAGATDKVLSSNGTDVSFSHEIAAAATASTIPLRDSGGRMKTATATSATDAIPRSYIDARFIDVLAYGALNTGSASDAGANVTAINNALAAVPAGGGVVFFPAGTYYINNTLNVKSNTLVLGAGPGSVIAAASTMAANSYFTGIGATAYVCLMNDSPTTYPGNTNISVQNIKIDMTSKDVGDGHCMHFRNSAYITVSNCTTTQGGDGIAITGCNYFNITNNMCLNHANAGIDMWEGSSYGSVVGNSVFGDIADTTSYGILVTGLTILNMAGTSHHIIVDANNVYNIGQLGIWLQGGVSGAQTGSVQNCTVSNNSVAFVSTFHGIRASEGYGHIISGNKISNIYKAGIVLQGEAATGAPQSCIIVNNSIRDANTSATADTHAIDIANGADQTLIQGNYTVRTGAYYVNALTIRAGATKTTLGLNYLQAGTSGTMSNAGTNTTGGGFQTDWTVVSFEHSYVNEGGAYQVCQYMRDAAGFVHLRGAFASGGGANATVTTLPSGFRPPATVILCVANKNSGGADTVGYLTVAADGTVNTLDQTANVTAFEGVFAVTLD